MTCGWPRESVAAGYVPIASSPEEWSCWAWGRLVSLKLWSRHRLDECDKSQAVTSHGESQPEPVAVCVVPLDAPTWAWARNPSFLSQTEWLDHRYIASAKGSCELLDVSHWSVRSPFCTITDRGSAGCGSVTTTWTNLSWLRWAGPCCCP